MQFFEACALRNQWVKLWIVYGSRLWVPFTSDEVSHWLFSFWKLVCLIWGSFTINRDPFLFWDILSKPQTKRSRVRILEWDRDSLLRLPKGKVVL